MDILMALIMIIAGFFFLVKGADLFVDSASGIAGKLGISPVVIGLTIVAFGTSMPELAVSVTAALEGANEIALGNVVGSNIFNLLVIAGGSACLYPLACDRILLKRDWPLSALAALVLGIFLFGDQRISRGEALILLAMFGAVLFMQLKGAKQTEEKAPETRPMGRLLLFLVIGIAAIVIGGQITVDGATSLARILGLSETLIGLTIVAVGTSLPELVTSLVAARKGENEIAMGNVVGSNLFNILCILGVSALLDPIQVEITALYDTAFRLAVTLIFWLICRHHKLDRPIGILMVITYVCDLICIILR